MDSLRLPLNQRVMLLNNLTVVALNTNYNKHRNDTKTTISGDHMVKSNIIICNGLMLLCSGAYSLENELVSFEELKNAYIAGIDAAIVLSLSDCKLIPSQAAPIHEENNTASYHEQNHENYQARLRFNINNAFLRGTGSSEGLFIHNSYRLPHTPKASATSIGVLYDVSVSVQLFASEEVHYFMKAQSLDQSEIIDTIFSCPWSSLIIKIKN